MEMWGRWCQFDDDSAFRVRVVGISGHGRGESSRKCILLPEFLIRRQLGIGGRIGSVEQVLALSAAARVSMVVAVRRLNELRELLADDFAVVVLEPGPDEAPVVAAACLGAEFSGLTRPKLYIEPPGWVRERVPGVLGTVRNRILKSRDRQWEYASRIVVNPDRRRQQMVEIRLDHKSI